MSILKTIETDALTGLEVVMDVAVAAATVIGEAALQKDTGVDAQPAPLGGHPEPHHNPEPKK